MIDVPQPHVQDLVASYVLDAVTPDEAALVEEHLAECAECRQLASELREVEARLPRLVGEMAPPPSLKTRLLTIVTAEAAGATGISGTTVAERQAAGAGVAEHATTGAALGRATTPEAMTETPDQAAPPPPISLRPARPAQSAWRGVRLSPLLAVAAALVLVVAGVAIWRAIAGAPPTPTLQYAMGGKAIPTAGGTVRYYRDGHKLVLDLHGLKAIPSGRVYELWLVRLNGASIVKAVGIGAFRPTAQGHGSLTVADGRVPANVPFYQLAAVTVERAPLSLTPHFPIVSQGQAA
jgi:hypothetical protein